ncbi:hypothetical protein BJ322DRAFT_1206587 [Thelephora terrestris]|uniref:Uncharacterized protein n=1 Tax=Thelephora terrestris TaxID=56493 RepID=A0A9P6H365_9AGAM|nr:hypothetical protein BJ322DRAFT_1206587 [Thelephora terrestris]
MQHLHVRSPSDETTVTHSPPSKNAIPVPFSYNSSDDGTPFANLGKQLKLPQTATLAIRAPEKIPYLYEEAFQWYESFDPLGDILPNPNPTPALDLLAKIFDHLINDCRWSPLNQLQKNFDSSISPLGSVVSVCGPLLSYPTLKSACPVPLLLFHRSPPADLQKRLGSIRDIQVGGEGMPRSKKEWEHMMRFWSEQLGRRHVSGLYEVM